MLIELTYKYIIMTVITTQITLGVLGTVNKPYLLSDIRDQF